MSFPLRLLNTTWIIDLFLKVENVTAQFTLEVITHHMQELSNLPLKYDVWVLVFHCKTIEFEQNSERICGYIDF